MDNKPLEIQAESLIQHKLLQLGFRVTKPLFDREGADLIIIQDISTNITPFVKVQCKGRRIKNSSNVKIPINYVTANFIVFLYLEKNDTKEDSLYVLFEDDIKQWKINQNNFILTISKNFRKQSYFKNIEITKSTTIRIENILLKQAIEQSVKTNDSIIIDGIFLEKAIRETRSIYKSIYPDKQLQKPNIDDFIKNILGYTHAKYKVDVNCYLIYSYHFSLEYFLDIGEAAQYDPFSEEVSDYVGHDYNLFKLKTKEIVSFKVEEQLERIINVENVILVADDIAYVPFLETLKEKGVEITLVHNSENSGSRMYHHFKWANIVYPLGLAMGLKQHEL